MAYRAGPKIPNKYKRIGPNYDKWGEQEDQGLIYDPYTDTYKVDPKQATEYYRDTGLLPKEQKPPGVLEQVAPIAAGTLAWEGGRQVAAAIPGLLGIGGEAAATTTGTAGAPTVGSPTGGLLNIGSAPATPSQPATPSLIGAERGGQFTPGPSAPLTAEGAFASYGIPMIAAYSAGKMAETGYGTLVKGEKPGKDADIHWGMNPVTAWAYWPLKFSGLLGHKSTKQVQAERAKSLIDKGVQGFKGFYEKTQAANKDYMDKFGDRITNSYGSRSDLDPDFVGVDPASGRWINNKFANSGKVEDLTAKDVWGSQGVFDTFGDDWLGKYTPEQREQVSQALLNAGIFSTDKGDVIIKGDKKDEAKAIADGIINPKEEEKKNA